MYRWVTALNILLIHIIKMTLKLLEILAAQCFIQLKILRNEIKITNRYTLNQIIL